MNADPVSRFAAAADTFCRLIEAETRPRQEQLVLALSEAVAELYAAALRLPNRWSATSDLPEERLSSEVWRSSYFPFAAALDEARACFEDADTDRREAFMFLTDDLGDIFRDVKEGLMLRDEDADEDDVIWQWRFNFWSHWGLHAANAISTMTAALAYIGGTSFESATRR